MTVSVYLLFIFCITPGIFGIEVLKALSMKKSTVNVINHAFILLFSAHSGINPFIYMLMNKQMRTAFRLLRSHPFWRWRGLRHEIEKEHCTFLSQRRETTASRLTKRSLPGPTQKVEPQRDPEPIQQEIQDVTLDAKPVVAFAEEAARSSDSTEQWKDSADQIDSDSGTASSTSIFLVKAMMLDDTDNPRPPVLSSRSDSASPTSPGPGTANQDKDQ